MPGVYGDFIECFPELMETFKVWTESETDCRQIRGIYIPTKGGGIDRRKFTSKNWVLDQVDSDLIYVKLAYKDKIKIGDYFRRNAESPMRRVTTKVEYDKSAGYLVFGIEKVEGSRPDQKDSLNVKGAEFV